MNRLISTWTGHGSSRWTDRIEAGRDSSLIVVTRNVVLLHRLLAFGEFYRTVHVRNQYFCSSPHACPLAQLPGGTDCNSLPAPFPSIFMCKRLHWVVALGQPIDSFTGNYHHTVQCGIMLRQYERNPARLNNISPKVSYLQATQCKTWGNHSEDQQPVSPQPVVRVSFE